MPGRAAGEIAYLAGVFDGEGTIQTAHRNYGVSVQMTDLDILERFQAQFGGAIYRRSLRKGQKQSWVWGLNRRNDVWDFLSAIDSYLGERRRAKVREFEDKCRWPKEFTNREKALLMMQDLGMNHREIGERLGLHRKTVECLINRPGVQAVA